MQTDVNMSDIWTYLIFNAGAGFILGVAVGYAAKKLLKLVLLLLGFLAIALLGLEYAGVIEVHYDKFLALVEKAVNTTQSLASGIASRVIAGLPFAASFLVGVAVGFKMG